MAVVSRNDDGKSRPVTVREETGEFVEHKAARQDLAYKNSPLSAGVKRMKDSQVTNWIENLSDNVSNWTDGKGLNFRLEGHGFFGSVINISDEIKNNAFVQRAVLRGNIKFLTEDEAMNRAESLIDIPSQTDESVSEMLKALDSGAARNMTTNFKEGVPDDAAQIGRPMTAKEIWANSKNSALKVALEKQISFEIDTDNL